MNATMRIALLNDTDGRKNLGCRLTSGLLKEQLERHFQAAFGAVRLQAFPWRFGQGAARRRTWARAAGWAARPAPDAVADRRFARWLPLLARREYGPDAVAAALHADLAVFQPEGSIGDAHDAGHILNLLSLPLLAGMRGIPLFVMNGTFPLFADRRGALLREFLKRCSYASMRDGLSAAHYDRPLMPDAAVMWEDRDGPPGGAPARSHVLITTGAGYTRNVNRALAREALAFCERAGLHPLVMTKQQNHLMDLRSEVLRLGGTFVERATPREAGCWLARCQVHIGGRYHMALFGLSYGVASVLVPVNTHKNRWLAETVPGVRMLQAVRDAGAAARTFHETAAEWRPRMRCALDAMRGQFHQEMERAVAAAAVLCTRPATVAEPRPEELGALRMHLALRDAWRLVAARPKAKTLRRMQAVAGQTVARVRHRTARNAGCA